MWHILSSNLEANNRVKNKEPHFWYVEGKPTHFFVVFWLIFRVHRFRAITIYIAITIGLLVMVVFSISSGDNSQGPRVGCLTTPHATLTTPVFLLHTTDGNPPYITPDLLKGLTEAKGLHISFHNIVELKEVLQKYGKGAHQFFHVNEYALFLSLRDPKVFLECPSSNSDSITVISKKGNKKVSLDYFVQMLGDLKVDISSSIFFDVSWGSSLKKTRKSVDLAISWLDALLPQLDPHSKEGIFGVVEGGRFQDQRIKSAKETALRPVAGFIIGGLECGESPQERAIVVDIVVKHLPENKPRMVIGPGCPEDVLDLIEKGVDIFCNIYPHLMTEHGFAITFPLDASQQTLRKLNLRDPEYIIDSQPLLKGCLCYSCTNHSRAYIYHLLNVHEMLGEVLLEIHNLHHYMEFFRVVREHIKSGSFATYKDWFLASVGE